MSETKRDDVAAPATVQTYAVDAPPKLARRWSFWAIQLVAWGAYGLLTYLSDLPSLAEAQMFSMLGVKLVRAAPTDGRATGAVAGRARGGETRRSELGGQLNA